ncbi:hypothetical protein [Streptomyces harbinensis]|uniref:hypothetical protein n=1 Tax=Streptomyces harbinensis TaxID=1176198 RepID=UPI003678918C
MPTYTVQYDHLGGHRPIPDLTVDAADRTTLEAAVNAHAKPYLADALIEIGHGHYADQAFFDLNAQGDGGRFIVFDAGIPAFIKLTGARITEAA